jgi:hypothetical protein
MTDAERKDRIHMSRIRMEMMRELRRLRDIMGIPAPPDSDEPQWIASAPTAGPPRPPTAGPPRPPTGPPRPPTGPPRPPIAAPPRQLTPGPGPWQFLVWRDGLPAIFTLASAPVSLPVGPQLPPTSPKSLLARARLGLRCFPTASDPRFGFHLVGPSLVPCAPPPPRMPPIACFCPAPTMFQ